MLKAERKIAAELVRIVGRLRLRRALVLIVLSLGARRCRRARRASRKGARDRSRCAHRVRRRPRSAWARLRHRGPCASPACISLLSSASSSRRTMSRRRSCSTAAGSVLASPGGRGLRPRLQLLGADEPHPAFLLGALIASVVADAVRQRDAPLRPVAMDKVVLGALPVGKSRLVLIGNLLRPRRVSLSPRGRG